MALKIRKLIKKLPSLNNPILIEGLPGIGNVGKVVVDFMIDELKAKKMMEIYSYSFPHSVFVNENNLVELPKIEVYFKKSNKTDLIFLAGDVQPAEESASYEFSNKILDIAQHFKTKEIITLGGIGLPAVPEKPKVYCTGNSRNLIKKYKEGVKINDKLYGVVGPIIGVTGLLNGLAGERKMKSICFLAETYGHPLYLGIKGSQEILKILNKKLNLKLNLKQLDKEVAEAEKEIIKRTKELGDITKLKKIKGKDFAYIG